MKCKRCGFDNPDYLEYCQNCTAPLEHNKAEDEGEPAWGFVKAPKWAKPEFSADTVSDSDVPTDYVAQGKEAARQAAAAGAAAAAAAVQHGKNKAAKAADKIEEAVAKAPYDAAETISEEFDELEDEFEDEFEDEYDEAGRAAAHASPLNLFGRFKKSKKSSRRYDDEDYDDDFDDELDEDEDIDADYEDEYEEYEGGRGYKPAKKSGSKDLRPLIRIVGVIAALAVLAVLIWLIARAASGCSKQKEFDPPVVEQSIENPDVYFVTVYADKGTKLVYETAGGDRTPYTVPESCLAKFRVPTIGLLPGEPVEGDTYYATPRVLVVNDDGTETPISIDPVALPIPSLNLEFDNESDNITSADGKAVISGRITYVNAELTMNGEPVEIASDGVFKKEYVFEDPGEYTINVEAKLPNYQIARRTFNVTVEETVVTNPDAFIQMPWDYGDDTFKQRVVNSIESIDVRGKVPEGASLTASCESDNATLTTPIVDSDGTFHFTITMKVAGDYVITLNCTTAQGNTFTRDVHVQRQPDYGPYIQNAWAMDYAAFSFGNSQQYKLEGKITEILHDGDYYLAKFELTNGHTVVLEYHHHYGSGRELKVGDQFTQVYGRSKGFDENGDIRFYVWFIND